MIDCLEHLHARHEWKRGILLPAGFELPLRPTEEEIDHYRDNSAFLHHRWQTEYEDSKRLFDRAMDEAKRLGVRDDFQWLKENHPRALKALTLSGGAPPPTYLIYNASLATTASPVKQPTGTAIRTMVQLKVGAGGSIRIVEWGTSFDASAAAVPGQVELFETTVAATMSTAYVNADVQRFGNGLGPQQGDTANLPIDVTGTATAGFATAAVTEGTVANYRGFDLLLAPPTGPYFKQWPLGREPDLVSAHFLRARVTFGATINQFIYLILES